MLLVVVTVVVLLLVARSWRAVAPTATAITRPDATAEADDAPRELPDDLPDLRQMQNETQAHADDVQEALQATE